MTPKNRPSLAALATFATLAGSLFACAPGAPPEPANAADTIFFGGSIVTVDAAQPAAEAVAVKDGRIVAVGKRADVEGSFQGAATAKVDLAGKALLPSFIDPHSHYFSSLSVANQVNVFAPPAGPGKDIPAIVEELRKFRDARALPRDELVLAYGYDDNVMPGGVGLTREDIDAVFPDNPVMVGHVSMHGAVFNSAALAKYGITAATPTPPGGIIVRKAGSNEPAGLLMETAYMPIAASLPPPNAQQEVEWTRAGQMLYAAAGITTAHEGATVKASLETMQRAAAAGAHIIDVVAYPFVYDFDAILAANPVESWGKYKDRLKLGGGKITVDGSPQGRTAFFTTPYLAGGPSGEKNWSGEPGFTQETLDAFVQKLYDLGLPINIHVNGDAAVDMMLLAHERAAASDLTRDRHVTAIHAQFTRADQLDKYVTYKITPSFYTEHTFYFGDTHILNRGEQQAGFLSPMRAAIDKGLRPTNHTDFVVAPLDQMFVVWTAVNRISRGDVVIGADQRVTPLEALQAITIHAARQYSEDDSKGSITVGKLADLVILDGNPLTVDPMAIKDIRVVETFKEGISIYQAR